MRTPKEQDVEWLFIKMQKSFPIVMATGVQMGGLSDC